jgi:predicted oxidoreductase
VLSKGSASVPEVTRPAAFAGIPLPRCSAPLPSRTDVLVAGSGIAGLSAAIEAASAGCRVTVVEADAGVGGASVMSGAACCLVGTALQARHGIADSVELALADWAKMGGPTADLDWARRYLEASVVAVYDWCESLGIRWESIAQPEGNSVPRWHVPAGWGREIVKRLLARARQLDVEIRCNAPVQRLITGANSVTGAYVSESGAEQAVSASAVVMCTGGFAANLDMVLTVAPQLRDLPRLLSGSSPNALGRGHELLRAVGAKFTCLDHLWIYPNGTPDPQDPRGERGLGVRGVDGDVWLNRQGERFHNETLRGGRSGTEALLGQPGQTCWSVLREADARDVLLIDNEYYATPAGPHAMAMAEFWQRSAYVWRGEDAAGLALAIGLPPEAVRASIEDFNRAIRSGAAADRYGRPLRGLQALEGPLRAIEFFPMAQKNFGGVATDEQCRVLSEYGGVLGGLYAAGELAGMAGGCINGRSALEGTMFGPCLYSGRVAGQACARLIRAAV